jgi:hypothetical protein
MGRETVSQPQPPWNPKGQQGQQPYPGEQYGPSGQQPPQDPRQPPPGWYPDPGGQQVLRWWDGRAWAPHTQPMPGPRQENQPPYPAVPAAGVGGSGAFAGQQGGAGQQGAPGWLLGPLPGAVIPSPRPGPPGPWAWGVASAPLLLLGVAAVVAAAVSVNVGVSQCLLIGALVAAVFAIFAAYRDARALRAAGEPVGAHLAWWCLLVPWAYLWARAVKRVNKGSADWGLLVGAAAAWLLVLVISVPVIGSVITDSSVFEQAQVQSQIASGIEAKSGVAVTVSCPKDPPLNPGSQFQCIATATDGSTTLVTVTIQDRQGDIIWQTGG